MNYMWHNSALPAGEVESVEAAAVQRLPPRRSGAGELGASESGRAADARGKRGNSKVAGSANSAIAIPAGEGTGLQTRLATQSDRYD